MRVPAQGCNFPLAVPNMTHGQPALEETIERQSSCCEQATAMGARVHRGRALEGPDGLL
jgi:hypothetical protein